MLSNKEVQKRLKTKSFRAKYPFPNFLAFNLGVNAFTMGLPEIPDNGYAPGTSQYKEYIRGWNSAFFKERKND